jgi:hypothetical protein
LTPYFLCLTLRNSRYIHAGTTFPCFSYHANMAVYVWNIKHLSLSTCILCGVH